MARDTKRFPPEVAVTRKTYVYWLIDPRMAVAGPFQREAGAIGGG